MDIDMHNLKAHEIVDIMKLYPNGHLLIKYDRVFWSVGVPKNVDTTAHGTINNQVQERPVSRDPFGKMHDTMMSMVCGK